ncbi:MAG: hypothetical protein HRT53_02335 [Colwellia sp.]|nr:hypothetical protein [Colwellia sp.]
MKNISITIALSSMFLFSCGGSEGDAATDTSKKDFIANLSNTSWKKECFPYSALSTDNSTALWYINIKVSINSSLKSTYKTEFFHPTDTVCNSVMFNTIDISKLEITDKVISEESIEAYGLNETFIYNSDSSDSAPSYTLIYIDSEKLYFGQKSGSNIGKTPETRHSSISLNDYFSQVIN